MRTVADIRDGKAAGIFLRPLKFQQMGKSLVAIEYDNGVGIPATGTVLFNPPPCSHEFMEDALWAIGRPGCVIAGDVVREVNGYPLIAGLCFNDTQDPAKWTVPKRELQQHCEKCPTDEPQGRAS